MGTENEANDTPETPTVDMKAPVRFKAAGADREMTIEEALQWASKGFGAEERFREAAERIKAAEARESEAQSAIQLKRDMDAIRSGDLDAFQRLATAFNVPQETVEYMLAQHQNQEGVEGAQGSGPQYASLHPQQLAILNKAARLLESLEAAKLDPAAELKRVRDYQMVDADSKARDFTKKVLTNDPFWARLIGRDSKHTILTDVWSRVQRRVDGGAQLTEKTIREAANEVRDLLTVFDANTAPPNRPGVHPGSFGSAPTSDAGISRLQPPKAPDPEKYLKENDLAGFVEAQIAYDSWQRANSQ